MVLVKKGGNFKDIDNKLKTICDALRVPKGNELPAGWRPEKGEEPFLCLLRDDELIYQIAVDTDFLLCEHSNHTDFKLGQNESMWIINVKIKGNRFDGEYMDLLV